MTECNHCLLSADEEEGEEPPRISRVSVIELWLDRKWHIMSRAGPWRALRGHGVRRSEGP